ncbi:MAG: hypothetical protein HZB38_09145 [Planctomycetes bacterium]|nr:hypothetical protein [Planctomycetota bacterium]
MGDKLFLTNNTWYTAKVVVEYQTSWPYANVLSLWVDTDGDADFSDETQLLYAGVTGAVGYCGVFRYTAATTVVQFDDVRIGTDNASPKDGDFVGGMGVSPVTGDAGFQPARFRNNDWRVRSRLKTMGTRK